MNITPIDVIPQLPLRLADSHKGTYGTVQVVAGSHGMSGAAVLVGRASLRAGAGLVRVACPSCIQDVVAGGYPSYTTFGIRQHTDGTFGDGAVEELLEYARNADVIAMGPGLGQGRVVSDFVRSLLAELTSIPIVLDADGLNAIAPLTSSFRKRAAPTVLTPHPGEFARLTGRTVREVQADREHLVIESAGRWGAIVLLKGVDTLVTDGVRLYRNTTGNPGMATGGSGDVLTGVIAALIGQGLSAFDAAVLGAWVHGRAGDHAARRFGQTAMTSVDLLESLPAAFLELESSW